MLQPGQSAKWSSNRTRSGVDNVPSKYSVTSSTSSLHVIASVLTEPHLLPAQSTAQMRCPGPSTGLVLGRNHRPKSRPRYPCCQTDPESPQVKQSLLWGCSLDGSPYV